MQGGIGVIANFGTFIFALQLPSVLPCRTRMLTTHGCTSRRALSGEACARLQSHDTLPCHQLSVQEATSLKDPFSEHLVAPDKEELVEIEKEVEGVFESPKPDHDKIEKLLTMQVTLQLLLLLVGVPDALH